MKNLTTILLLLTLFYSCAKDGEVGPKGAAGQNGTNGTNGNANVHSYFVTNPTAAQWTFLPTYNSYYHTFSIPEITDEIIRKGTVDVFFGQTNTGTGDTTLTPLPELTTNGTYIQGWTVNIKPGLVTIDYFWNGTTTPNPGSWFGFAFFKFVVIDGLRIKNPNNSIREVKFY